MKPKGKIPGASIKPLSDAWLYDCWQRLQDEAKAVRRREEEESEGYSHYNREPTPIEIIRKNMLI